ncbi:hypothetical protein [Actinoallomurus acaciae]|uniref:Uncharacterized protein n=1 Tax=Actinoallomurus acaciae TaxID=502577 RepID=A0ABV5YQ91_9ACTN
MPRFEAPGHDAETIVIGSLAMYRRAGMSAEEARQRKDFEVEIVLSDEERAVPVRWADRRIGGSTLDGASADRVGVCGWCHEQAGDQPARDRCLEGEPVAGPLYRGAVGRAG